MGKIKRGIMRNLIIGAVLLVLAGFGKGISDRIAFHPQTLNHIEWMQNDWCTMNGWKSKWALDEDRNPLVSDTDDGILWVKNGGKYYKEKFFLSSTLLVVISDLWHFSQFIYKWFMIFGSVLFYYGFSLVGFLSIVNKPKWMEIYKKIPYIFIIILTVLLAGIFVSIGFAIAYR